MRKTKLNKEMLLEKIKKQSGFDWRKSKYVYVISALETDLYDITSCIKDLMRVVDDICFSVADLNGVRNRFAKETNARLGCQLNYVHLSDTDSGNNPEEPHLVKQGSDKWHSIRETARVTGSSMNNAIGLGSLKQQTEHFDKVVYHKKPKEPSSDVQMKMKHGSEEEINAVATLVSKVLPVFEPTLVYVEEGCYKLHVGERCVPLVVSPDGSLREDTTSMASYGVECKCPFPGKTYATPVYYKIPHYYVTQLLAEMFALNCNKLYFICYTKESSTIFIVDFCRSLWNDIVTEASSIYGDDNPVRPTRKSFESKVIKEKVQKFTEDNVRFIAEVQSVRASCCEHTSKQTYCVHSKAAAEHEVPTLNELKEAVYRAAITIDKAYELTRTRATELLGFLISDMDREYMPEMHHAVPVAYGLKGYSLPNQTVRIMIEFVLKECWKKGLYTPVCSFDGQWSRLAVRDRDDEPLTVLQLQKDVYTNVKKMTKGDIINTISGLNNVGLQCDSGTSQIEIERRGSSVSVSNNFKNKRIVLTKHLQNMMSGPKHSDEHHIEEDQERVNEMANVVLSSLQEHHRNEIEDELVNDIAILSSTMEVGTEEKTSSNTSEIEDNLDTLFSDVAKDADEGVVEMEEVDINEARPCDITSAMDTAQGQEMSILKAFNTHENLTVALGALVAKPKNKDMSLRDFKSKLVSADAIDSSFTKAEIISMIAPFAGNLRSNGIKCTNSLPKSELTSRLSAMFGDGSVPKMKMRKRISSPPSLACLARKGVQKIPKNVLNCVYAQFIFPEKMTQWTKSNPFGTNINIEGMDTIKPAEWYSRPEYNEVIGSYIFMILDAYHQLCGLRRVFCGPGMPKAGVSSSPILAVAENSDSNGCGLNVALARDMIDKQSVAYAKQTFSEDVEVALKDIKAEREATFCNIVRNWYLSEDDPGVSAIDRCSAKLEFRDWLLSDVRFDVFPPYGSYVKDIPIVLFEGLLTGIERKIQLYPFVKSGAYNVRAVGSLDIENFFGSFQDIDPRGSGVLRPDDISVAVGTAMELLEARLNPERGFHMTTARKRVYPVNQHMPGITAQQSLREWQQPFKDLSSIRLRDHSFDLPTRARGKRTRKSGKISKPSESAKNPFPMREYHKASEAKILPHVRRGLQLTSFCDLSERCMHFNEKGCNN